MGTRRSMPDVEKAKRMGLSGVLAESVYVNLGKKDDALAEDSPPLEPWRETILPFSHWAGRSLRNDLMCITITGTLYYNQSSRCIQFLEPRELSMVEKRKNDSKDVADIFVGDRVETKIPCLDETWIHVSTLPQFQVHERDRFQEFYPEYWENLDVSMQKYITDYDFNCDVFVNPDTCELKEGVQGTLRIPLHSLTKAYWTMNLSAEEGNKFTQKDRIQFLVGFTGARDAQDVPERTGAFIVRIPPYGSGQRITVIFMSMLALRLMLMSYYVWMTDGSLERKAYRYGLEMPAKAYSAKELARRNQIASHKEKEGPATSDPSQTPLPEQAPIPDDDGAGGEEDADSVPQRRPIQFERGATDDGENEPDDDNAGSKKIQDIINRLTF